jgi:hypothetical protein
MFHYRRAVYELAYELLERCRSALALAEGSPAIDTVTDGPCLPPAKDQQGVKQHQDDNGDGGLPVTPTLLSSGKSIWR